MTICTAMANDASIIFFASDYSFTVRGCYIMTEAASHRSMSSLRTEGLCWISTTEKKKKNRDCIEKNCIQAIRWASSLIFTIGQYLLEFRARQPKSSAAMEKSKRILYYTNTRWLVQCCLTMWEWFFLVQISWNDPFIRSKYEYIDRNKIPYQLQYKPRLVIFLDIGTCGLN